MKKWKRNDFVSFKRQIFISSINNYQINYQLVTSCLRIARSYKVATVGVNNKPVQNTRYRLIQPRSVFNLTDITSVNESPQRLTKFICGFRKYHSVCSNIWEVSFVTTSLILMPLTRKCFGWIHLWTSCSFP